LPVAKQCRGLGGIFSCTPLDSLGQNHVPNFIITDQTISAPGQVEENYR